MRSRLKKKNREARTARQPFFNFRTNSKECYYIAVKIFYRTVDFPNIRTQLLIKGNIKWNILLFLTSPCLRFPFPPATRLRPKRLKLPPLVLLPEEESSHGASEDPAASGWNTDRLLTGSKGWTRWLFFTELDLKQLPQRLLGESEPFIRTNICLLLDYTGDQNTMWHLRDLLKKKKSSAWAKWRQLSE